MHTTSLESEQTLLHLAAASFSAFAIAPAIFSCDVASGQLPTALPERSAARHDAIALMVVLATLPAPLERLFAHAASVLETAAWTDDAPTSANKHVMNDADTRRPNDEETLMQQYLPVPIRQAA
jgi:hypothetical protein